VSAISCAALVVAAALLSGCGGGHGVHATSSTARAQSSVTLPAATSATTPKVTPSAPRAYWAYEKLIAHLAGRTVELPTGGVQLQSTLLECNGDGAPIRTGTTRRWSHFTCTQTLFQNGADRDVTFDVTILSASQLTVGSPRYGPE
jgi:hypothetical protein